MNKLLTENKKRQKEMHSIERSAWFHLIFIDIHPFIDGNGRTVSLVLILDLMQNGYPPVKVKAADQRRYYDTFESYYREGDAALMTKLIAAYVDERLEDYLAILEPQKS